MSPSAPLSRPERPLAVLVFAGSVALFWSTQGPVGHVRDEGYYFTAARSYEGWFRQLGSDFAAGRLLEPFRDASIVRHWEYNHEHPPLAKALFAGSHLLLHEKLGVLDDTTAFRLPAFVLAGLASLFLFLLARPWGLLAAVLAPLLFWAVPRHFFHAHLAAFDVPVVTTWLLWLWTWQRAMERGRGAALVGLAFGLALATKHNALFLPFVAVGHWLVTDHVDLRRAGLRGAVNRIPAALWAMALLGPLVLYLSWPYLWHHPIDRVAWWIGFHLHHVHYPWQYLGTVLREPPFPWAYPLVLEALTLPAATLVLLALAALRLYVSGFIGFFRREAQATGAGEWLLLIAITAALAPFLTTRTPIFGGIKHWLAAVALLCVPAARLLVDAGRALSPGRASLVTVALAGLVLAPAAVYTARFHPWGTSAYNELAGGAAGGAALGMQRQYWSNNVTAVLPWINEHAPRGAAVYLHEVNHESFLAYRDDGLVRPDLRWAWTPQSAAIAAVQYHQEFRDREFEIWDDFGTRTPSLTFAIDEAPQVMVYERGGPR
jgi:MFS family permease